jgi:hypothetical protein
VSTHALEIVPLGDEVGVAGRLMHQTRDVGGCDVDPRSDETEGSRRGTSLDEDVAYTSREGLDLAEL